jgi:hypothetical protein
MLGIDQIQLFFTQQQDVDGVDAASINNAGKSGVNNQDTNLGRLRIAFLRAVWWNLPV